MVARQVLAVELGGRAYIDSSALEEKTMKRTFKTRSLPLVFVAVLLLHRWHRREQLGLVPV